MEKHVDEDWKKRAQAEREALKAAVEAEEEEEDAGGMPRADFLTLAASFVAQASIHLGLAEHPIHKEVRRDLRQARYAIDMLAVIQEKTRGNLADEEKKFVDTALTELRLKFVDEMKSGAK